MEVDAPKQLAQPSRKGRKAWRKNVDVSDIQQGLEKVREEKILVGTTLNALSSDQLFAVDTTSSESALKKVGKKPLKVDEILAQRSAIPALVSRKRSIEDETAALKKKGKVQGVTYKELGRLLRVAGRTADGKSSLANLETDSRIIKDVYDVWADGSEETKIVDIAEKRDSRTRKKKDLLANADAIRLFETTSYAKMQKPPPTRTRPPIAFKESRKAVDVPLEGKSYNPSLESWQELLAHEKVALDKAEKARLRELERKEKIERLGELLDERERLGLDEAESDDEERASASMSTVEVKKEEEPGNATNMLPALPTDIDKTTIDLTKPKKNIRKHKLGKYPVMERPIEVKLSDELTDSLRLVKPEGSLAKDRFISLQERGIIESRVQVMPGRKYKKKVTEKWSYKDIK
ncbi:ribosome biogenesis protein Nop53/GLTSCR2 [Lipomyces orientalis]|uniref:Ribosome biogenesis protein Nop53/GLTSCR2 n=1 Tax=Lipomyces orientalis TaxID=1233043 RepID=A0ACC3TSW4_9ASCO